MLIPVGIAWRAAPLGLPQFAWKYGGSMLWAAMVYWALAGVLPRWRPLPLAGLTTGVSLAVELFKLVRSAPVDRFRGTLAGKLLLGRYFSLGALLAYVLAIGVAFAADTLWHPGRRTRVT